MDMMTIHEGHKLTERSLWVLLGSHGVAPSEFIKDAEAPQVDSAGYYEAVDVLVWLGY